VHLKKFSDPVFPITKVPPTTIVISYGASCVNFEIIVPKGKDVGTIEMKYKNYGTNGWEPCVVATPRVSGACKAFAIFRNFSKPN
jgi:hypothetical protein